MQFIWNRDPDYGRPNFLSVSLRPTYVGTSYRTSKTLITLKSEFCWRAVHHAESVACLVQMDTVSYTRLQPKFWFTVQFEAYVAYEPSSKFGHAAVRGATAAPLR
ncbi:hypothetical protein EVAR_42727_1 [Eumeta japonica]|uniref:Uncharacterized protein n=1 Tax=Eumeta variegata TaxID=151549 RepID=A0A4C1XIU9_EUMVA|nr:hypothetical protein EVAR_42727_1 [Eumeta japonica]